MKPGDKIYIIDNDGELKYLKIKDFANYRKDKVWLKLSNSMSMLIEINRIAVTKEEALNKFEQWKTDYETDLLTNDKWIKRLYTEWCCVDDDITPKEIDKIMKKIIKNKTGVEITDFEY